MSRLLTILQDGRKAQWPVLGYLIAVLDHLRHPEYTTYPVSSTDDLSLSCPLVKYGPEPKVLLRYIKGSKQYAWFWR